LFDDFVSAIISQLGNQGISGVLVIGLAVAIYSLWKELQAERRRSEDLVDKMQELSKDTMIMIERITNR